MIREGWMAAQYIIFGQTVAGREEMRNDGMLVFLHKVRLPRVRPPTMPNP